ncbi:hypothetical protein ACJJTC_018006 [Scirpophaga incertulas]
MVRESDESFKSREENDEIYEPSQNIDLDNIGGSNMVLRPRHNKELHEANVMELQLGLTSRPMPLGAPPRDVVRQILHRAQDSPPQEQHSHESDHAMREVIAIAQTGTTRH